MDFIFTLRKTGPAKTGAAMHPVSAGPVTWHPFKKIYYKNLRNLSKGKQYSRRKAKQSSGLLFQEIASYAFSWNNRPLDCFALLLLYN